MTDDMLDQDKVRELTERTARLPRELAPPQDAWAGIRAAIEAPAPMAQKTVAMAFWQRPAFLAAAALLLVAGSSAITAIALGGRQPSRAGERVVTSAPTGQASSAVNVSAPASDSLPVAMAKSSSPPASSAGVVAPRSSENVSTGSLVSSPSSTPSTLAEFTLVENEYISSVNRLSAMLESDQVVLSDRTIAKLKESIRVIDAAILEARRALAADPANRQLIEMLSTTYNQKIDLLKRTTEMGRS